MPFQSLSLAILHHFKEAENDWVMGVIIRSKSFLTS